MKHCKRPILTACLALLSLGLVACAPAATPNPSATQMMSETMDNQITLGVSPTPHGVLIEALADEFEKEGLSVKVLTFDDYVTPNHALAEGDIDANYFQHEPYLKAFSAEHKLALANLGFVHLEPMGLYSTKYQSLDALQEGDEILVPNDVTNGARALRLLEKAGLITLDGDPKALDLTVLNIKDNPKHLKITPIVASSITAAYGDVAAGVINSNYCIVAGLDPRTALVREETTGNPYANLVAVRQGEENLPKFQKLMKVLHSDKAKEILNTRFEGAVVPAN